MEPVTGVEPVLNAWKALVIPLDQTDVVVVPAERDCGLEQTPNVWERPRTLLHRHGLDGENRTHICSLRRRVRHPLRYIEMASLIGVEPTT